MCRITGHYPVVVSVGRGQAEAAEQEAISYGSWSGWLVDRDVPADRGDDDIAMKGDAPYRFRQVQRMGERGAVGQSPHPYRIVAAGDHWAAVL